MIRLPSLIIAGCVVCAALVLVGFGFIGNHRPASGARPPPAEIEPAAPEMGKLAGAPLNPKEGPPETRSSADSANSPLRDVRLTGVVIAPDLRIAIFAVNGTNPLVLSEGEALKDWRIDSIAPERVVLGSPAGSMVLAPKPDANLVRLPPPAAVPSGQIETGMPPGAAMAAPLVPPVAVTPVTVVNLPVPTPVPTQAYPSYSPEYSAGYDQYYPPYDYYPYLYSYPYLAFSVPTRVGFRFGFFGHHDLHHVGFHRAAFHGGRPGRHR